MAVLSVNAMIRHAKQNATLYEAMVELGYLDESFPVWWYSPGREGTEVKTVGQGGTTSKEGEQIAGRRTELQEGEDFAPTPPDTPAPREGSLTRPALAPSSSLPTPTEAFDVVPAPSKASSFSDVELSLLKERRITRARFSTFSNLRNHIERIAVDGDTVWVEFRYTGEVSGRALVSLISRFNGEERARFLENTPIEY
jgi:hypothetical protein